MRKTNNDHLYEERYILAHEAYKAALWDRTNKPKCFEDSDDAIVIAHNSAIGTAFAKFQVDLNIQVDEINRIAGLASLREEKIRVLETRCARLQDKVRQQGEELKQKK